MTQSLSRAVSCWSIPNHRFWLGFDPQDLAPIAVDIRNVAWKPSSL
jgi:hypothetical protein